MASLASLPVDVFLPILELLAEDHAYEGTLCSPRNDMPRIPQARPAVISTSRTLLKGTRSSSFVGCSVRPCGHRKTTARCQSRHGGAVE